MRTLRGLNPRGSWSTSTAPPSTICVTNGDLTVARQGPCLHQLPHPSLGARPRLPLGRASAMAAPNHINPGREAAPRDGAARRRSEPDRRVADWAHPGRRRKHRPPPQRRAALVACHRPSRREPTPRSGLLAEADGNAHVYGLAASRVSTVFKVGLQRARRCDAAALWRSLEIARS